MEINTMPFELNRLYNLDCEKSIKQIPDKYSAYKEIPGRKYLAEIYRRYVYIMDGGSARN